MFFPDLQQLSEKLKFAAAYQPASVLNYLIKIQLNAPKIPKKEKKKANHFKIIIICYWFLLEVLLFSVNCTSKKLKNPQMQLGECLPFFPFSLIFNGSHHIQ